MKIQIVSLKKSDRKTKKYEIVFFNPNTNETIVSHFGSKGSQTYLNHNDHNIKENYIKRHVINEKRFWNNRKAYYKPAVLSRFILWNLPTLKDSIIDYSKRFDLEIKKK